MRFIVVDQCEKDIEHDDILLEFFTGIVYVFKPFKFYKEKQVEKNIVENPVVVKTSIFSNNAVKEDSNFYKESAAEEKVPVDTVYCTEFVYSLLKNLPKSDILDIKSQLGNVNIKIKSMGIMAHEGVYIKDNMQSKILGLEV